MLSVDPFFRVTFEGCMLSASIFKMSMWMRSPNTYQIVQHKATKSPRGESYVFDIALILEDVMRMSCWSSSSKFHKGVIRSPLDILEMPWIQSPQVRRCKLRGSPQDEGICNFLSDEILHHTSTASNLHSHLLKLDGWKHGMLKPGRIFKTKKPP